MSNHRYLVTATRPDNRAGDGGEFLASNKADAIAQFKAHTKADVVGWTFDAQRIVKTPEVAPEDRPGKA